MNTHHYSPDEALSLLRRKLQERDETLATLVGNAINAGKEETFPIENTLIHDRAKKSDEYRKIVPFSPEEALQVALEVLQAYFIEQPLLVNEIDKIFAAASDETLDRAFEIQIELHTETQIDEGDDHEFRISQISEEDIEGQEGNLILLKEFIHFSEG